MWFDVQYTGGRLVDVSVLSKEQSFVCSSSSGLCTRQHLVICLAPCPSSALLWPSLPPFSAPSSEPSYSSSTEMATRWALFQFCAAIALNNACALFCSTSIAMCFFIVEAARVAPWQFEHGQGPFLEGMVDYLKMVRYKKNYSVALKTRWLDRLDLIQMMINHSY